MNNLTLLNGKVYPDKSLTIGIVPRKKARSQDKQYERALREQSETDYSALSDWYEGINSIEGKFCSLTDRPPLFIESPKSSRKARGSYGKHGITGFGRKVVKNGSLLLEKKYGKQRLGFVTCTLPSYSRETHHKINSLWSEIQRRFYQKLKRQLEKISKPFIYVGVTEIQEKRFEKYGVPCPHLHFVYVCRDASRKPYYLFICQLHRAWNESLRECLAIALPGIPESEAAKLGSVHAKRVQKSASAYLGKYMSKGVKVLEKMKEAGWKEFPKQWWTACMQTKKMFKESIIRLSGSECAAIFYGFEHYLQEGLITWGSFVEIEISGVYRTVGLVATLSKEAYDIFSEDP